MSPPPHAITIRSWTPVEDTLQITRMLHEAYAPLARLGFRYLATHQEDAITRQRLLQGWSFLAVSGDEIVGTITLRRADPQSLCHWYQSPEVFIFGQFAVAPRMQSRGIGKRLLEHVENHARSEGATELALDTAQGARHLIQWYQRLGYRNVGSVSWPETNYTSLILSKMLSTGC